VQVHPTLPADLIFGYRNKMEFSCTTRRWLLPHELGREEIVAGMGLGLHVPGTFDKVLDIEACLLLPEQGSRMLSDVREFIRASALPVYGLRAHEGFWRFAVLRHSVAHDQWMVNIVTAWEEPAQVLPLAERLTRRYPNVVSVVNNITGRKAGIAVGESEVLLAGQPTIEERIGPYAFELSANSFFQTNSRGAARLYDTVKAYAGLTGGETVVDLYCGTGTIAIYLSDRAGQVIGLEVVESAVADAGRNCLKNGVDNCRFIGGDIRHTLSQLVDRPDVMVIDPPRVGMHEDVVRQVLELAPRRIVYVSCNPATLARDAALLKENYRVAEVQPVDMFPHTFHIESVARMERR
jgi:23S rRNA (uracil1939-C5)-methyltransferase